MDNRDTRNLVQMSQTQLFTFIKNQGDYKKIWVELGDKVVINCKHIRPRKRKGDLLPKGVSIKKEHVVVKFN